MSFSIKTQTKKIPSLGGRHFLSIKNEMLGENYELSLVFVGKLKIKKLNFDYRKKDEPTDILSFGYDKKCGEIFICEEISKKKAVAHSKTLPEYLKFIFIHGILHLKGMNHGSKMESEERKWYKKFSI